MSGQAQWALSDGFSPRPAVLGWWVVTICIVFAVVAMGFFVARRNKFPIVGRFNVMMINGSLVLLQMIWNNLPFVAVPCAASAVIVFVTTQISLICYAYRVFDLLFKLNIARSLKYGSTFTEDEKNLNWFLAHRRFASPSFRNRAIACYVILCLLIIVAMAIVDPNMKQREWCTLPAYLHRINALSTAVWFTVFAITGCKLKDESNDGLNFKRELKMTFVFGLFCVIPVIIITAATAGPAVAWEFGVLVRGPMYMCVFLCGYLYPVHLSYKQEKIAMNKSRRQSLGPEQLSLLLTKLIVSSDFPILLDFLKSEFSAENGVFLRAYSEVRQNPESSPTVEALAQLASQFIYPDSIGEVNIPYDMRLPIMKLIPKHGSRGSRQHSFRVSRGSGNGEKPAEVTQDEHLQRLLVAFDSARDEVFRAVCRDSLPRFLLTEQGSKIRETLLAPPPSSESSTSSIPRMLRGLMRNSVDLRFEPGYAPPTPTSSSPLTDKDSSGHARKPSTSALSGHHLSSSMSTNNPFTATAIPPIHHQKTYSLSNSPATPQHRLIDPALSRATSEDASVELVARSPVIPEPSTPVQVLEMPAEDPIELVLPGPPPTSFSEDQ